MYYIWKGEKRQTESKNGGKNDRKTLSQDYSNAGKHQESEGFDVKRKPADSRFHCIESRNVF